MARPRKEGVEAEAAAEERRGVKEGGREGRGFVEVVVVEVRRRFKAVRTQVGLLARRRVKAGRAAVWRSREAEALVQANIGMRAWEGEGRRSTFAAWAWVAFVVSVSCVLG